MRLLHLIIFLTVFLSVYGLINYYIFIRGLQSIPGNSSLRTLYLILFPTLVLSFIFGRVLEKFTICALSDLFIWIGSLWFGLMLYLFLAILVIDCARLANHIFNVFPQALSDHIIRVKSITAIIVIVLSTITVAAGYINALHPRIKTINITIPKKASPLSTLNIVFVSDIHLGTIISNARLNKMVKMINSIRPDIVLLGGDIVDEDLEPVIERNLGETLSTIKSKYGTYAVTGNHEYIGGVEAAHRYLTEHGIRVLRDSVIRIDKAFYVAGREDWSITRFTGISRKSIRQIVENVDKEYPIILMDHQPFGIKEAIDNKIDLQLSGHTHHGQLWPLNYITSLIYDISWGYKEIEGTHFYVSCGYGTWGPPVRIGNRPEIVNIRVSFE